MALFEQGEHVTLVIGRPAFLHITFVKNMDVLGAGVTGSDYILWAEDEDVVWTRGWWTRDTERGRALLAASVL